MAKKGKKAKGGEGGGSPLPKQSTGIADLDDIHLGGVPIGSSVLFAGTSGTGKTTMCLEILCRGVAEGDPGIIFSSSETPQRVMENMTPFEFYDNSIVDDGRLVIKDMNELYKKLGIEHPDTGLSRDDASKLLEAIIEAVDGAEAKRVVIDSLTDVLATFDNESGMRTFIRDMVRAFADKGITLYLTSALAPDSVQYSSMGIEDALVDGVIMLSNIENRGNLLRGLQIVKMRGSKHSRARYIMDVTTYGLIIVPILRSYTMGGGE